MTGLLWGGLIVLAVVVAFFLAERPLFRFGNAQFVVGYRMAFGLALLIVFGAAWLCAAPLHIDLFGPSPTPTKTLIVVHTLTPVLRPSPSPTLDPRYPTPQPPPGGSCQYHGADEDGVPIWICLLPQITPTP